MLAALKIGTAAAVVALLNHLKRIVNSSVTSRSTSTAVGTGLTVNPKNLYLFIVTLGKLTASLDLLVFVFLVMLLRATVLDTGAIAIVFSHFSICTHFIFASKVTNEQFNTFYTNIMLNCFKCHYMEEKDIDVRSVKNLSEVLTVNMDANVRLGTIMNLIVIILRFPIPNLQFLKRQLNIADLLSFLAPIGHVTIGSTMTAMIL